ncbi:TPA: hypothetical protein I9092_003170 [Clostridium perfringens]|uniref:Uncharacterized protein n=1 Tax=Clostridium perfringens TaxID=1502 RepID=F8UNJ0_CLOPF|nr:hypothetical protein [Clostridium perfringens]USQ66316.1 hypothetical protein GOM42_14875 [Clostridium sp. 16K-1-R1]AEJ34198.1 conserved hypothetical protein [Clostridium perfringens]AEP95039.1 hypothetical protein pNetB_00063 [Clostridium perfringens]AFV15068.1 hypothetical protein pNetB-NE10_62 [Clostridium perfringens]MBO3304389.1 hypothetical protein [Clostridium perfringens]
MFKNKPNIEEAKKETNKTVDTPTKNIVTNKSQVKKQSNKTEPSKLKITNKDFVPISPN